MVVSTQKFNIKNARHSLHLNRLTGMLLLFLSAAVVITVFWLLRLSAITLAGDASCDLQEHIHGEKCYECVLICDDTSGTHIHASECYETKLICDISEHVHTDECYSDVNADVETQLDWQNMVSALELTGNRKSDLIIISASQIGYQESTKNFITEMDGKVRRGYTRYGAWYGSEYGQWSASFVSFCLHYAGFTKPPTAPEWSRCG